MTMTETAIDYAKVLHSLDIDKTSVESAKKVFEESPELVEALSNPVISMEEKEKVISRIFDGLVKNFVLVACKYGAIGSINEIFSAYNSLLSFYGGVLDVDVICTTEPSKEQQEKLKSFVAKKYAAKTVHLNIVKDESIIGGFVIKVGDIEYDRSLKGRLNKLQQRLVGEVS